MNQPVPSQPAAVTPDAAAAGPPLVVPVLAEQVVVGRELAETGRVRLNRRVHEEEALVQVPLLHDEVQVERVPLNQYLEPGAAMPATRYEGDTLVVPVLREELVVQKRLVLVEELRVVRRHHHTTHSELVVLRREEVSVERVPPDAPAA